MLYQVEINKNHNKNGWIEGLLSILKVADTPKMKKNKQHFAEKSTK